MKKVVADPAVIPTEPMPGRRQFGKWAIAGVGALTLPVWSMAASKKGPHWKHNGKSLSGEHKVDVVIVGAGLSGLIAARKLKKAGKTVLVLEARDRIGGRMVGRKTICDGFLDFGGQWMGKTQYDLQSLVTELGIKYFTSYETGVSIQSWTNAMGNTKTGFNGDVSQLLAGQCGAPGEFPKPYSPACEITRKALPDCTHDSAQAEIWKRLMKIVHSVPADKPWAALEAKKYDAITFAEWLKQEGAVDYSHWLPSMQARIGGSGAFEPDQVSVLHMAWTQKVGPQSETPEKWLLHGGAGQIPPMLAKQLGNCIVLDAPVRVIERLNEYKVRITAGADKNLFISAKAVIVAIPPSLREKIRFVPELPAAYTEFMKGAPMGSLSKVHAVYERAFWRKDCLSGSAAGNMKTCEFIADSSPPSGCPGILTSFIAGRRNEELLKLSDDQVKEAVLADYVSFFGDNVANPKDFVLIRWSKEEWTGGAFTAHTKPGTWTTSGEQGWREPVDNIFWAGTECSDRWPGYFDGAIRAGKIASLGVLARIFAEKEAAAA